MRRVRKSILKPVRRNIKNSDNSTWHTNVASITEVFKSREDLMICLRRKDNSRLIVPAFMVHQELPQMLIKYYEDRLEFLKFDKE